MRKFIWLKSLRVLWMQRIYDALRVGRRELSREQETEDDDHADCANTDGAPKKEMAITFRDTIALDITPEGAVGPLTMLNVLRPCMLLVNRALGAFLQNEFVASLREMARSQQTMLSNQPRAPFSVSALSACRTLQAR